MIMFLFLVDFKYSTRIICIYITGGACLYLVIMIDLNKSQVVGSNPTVPRHIFQAFPVWLYTQSNITSMIYSIFQTLTQS
jgi:hypothetical protein